MHLFPFSLYYYYPSRTGPTFRTWWSSRAGVRSVAVSNPLPAVAMTVATMTLRAARQRNVVLAVVGASMLVSLLLLSQTHSRLRRAEDDVEKCQQKHDSVAAQLTVRNFPSTLRDITSFPGPLIFPSRRYPHPWPNRAYATLRISMILSVLLYILYYIYVYYKKRIHSVVSSYIRTSSSPKA